MIHENFASEWNRQFSSKIHKEKLVKIKMREPKLINSLLQANPFNKRPDIERSLRIDRENKILYERLIVISERKSPKSIPHSVSPFKTLNSKYKKLEADRITFENMHLVNRLSSNSSDLSMKKMIKDYKLNEAYRERISRKNLQARIKKAVNTTNKQTLPKLKPQDEPKSDLLKISEEALNS